MNAPDLSLAREPIDLDVAHEGHPEPIQLLRESPHFHPDLCVFYGQRVEECSGRDVHDHRSGKHQTRV